MNYFLFIKDYWIRKHTSAPNVLDTAETIELIVENNLSVSRFGDGELDLILGINHPKFQNASSLLAYKLKMILSNPPRTSGCLVCLPKIFTMNDLAIFNKKARHHFFKFISRNRSEIYNHIDFKYIYGNAQFTRQYIDLKDKSKSKEYFAKVKQIWENKDVVIIEGRFTRFGVGNDLLSNARSVRRILCPETDAFSKYNEILEEVKKLGKNLLFLLALGPTATVMAVDLSEIGYRAIDIGHLDIEYEWYLEKAVEKVKIKNKYTNEADDVINEETDNLKDKVYNEQIIKYIK